jgi:hypothetical protein
LLVLVLVLVLCRQMPWQRHTNTITTAADIVVDVVRIPRTSSWYVHSATG